MDEKTKKYTLRKGVFFPPWILAIVIVVISLVNTDGFINGMNAVSTVMLDSFAWLFNSTILYALGIIIIIYFSPLANVRIGGSQAKPIMKYRDLIWITLCTTIAAGILFWACAEPLYHYYAPSVQSGADPGSTQAAIFAMKTMYLEWTWSPYAIYTLATLGFAFAFYNMDQKYTVAAALVPLFGKKVLKFSGVIDVVCLFALMAGVAASLGTGTLTIAGGLESVFGIESNSVSWGIIITIIVVTFVVSSISGIMNGVRILSSINAKIYMILLLFVFIFGPTVFMLNFGQESWGEYIRDFIPMSLYTGEIYNDGWAKAWPIFYWCNWLAWAPSTGIFLAGILKGYTIRQAIHCNFVIPSIFATIWMGLFSTATLYYEMDGLKLYETMLQKGSESVVYSVFEQLPLAGLIIPFYLFIVFISFVTASDSNTTAMGGLCTNGVTQDDQKSPSWLKVILGVTIAMVTWVTISFAGIDGIKAASNLGGFPNIFLILLIGGSLLKVAYNPAKYDIHKEDYTESKINKCTKCTKKQREN
ncbi:BCCT family transporter [Candidatus Epulonipiscium viviparus]|uniref:BCCT family transporter n=1 Tax=Candidatus Epulonipiscium viviparus TaxID=420336 RepID=UPI00016C09E1|nr:BCCT family transporter [Candidatus Epulopiscium viviparus]